MQHSPLSVDDDLGFKRFSYPDMRKPLLPNMRAVLNNRHFFPCKRPTDKFTSLKCQAFKDMQKVIKIYAQLTRLCGMKSLII